MMASCSMPAKELAEEGVITMTPNWLELPRHVTENILQRLDTFEIVTSVCRVCPLWWKIYKDPFMWRTIHMTNDYGNSPYNSEKVCRYAIDRSCGQLEDINIHNFGSDDLLNYIANSASQLKRLRLSNCVGISDKALCQVAMKLPLLEELGLSHIDYLSKDSLEAFGRSCPLLKVFKLNMPLVTFFSVDNVNDGVFAISKTMPNLHQLLISGIVLSEDGLLAILDGCPLLQSLDVENCVHVNSMGASPEKRGHLEERCHQQIKEIHLPKEYSVAKCPFGLESNIINFRINGIDFKING